MLYSMQQEDWSSARPIRFRYFSHRKEFLMLSSSEVELINAALDQGHWFLECSSRTDEGASKKLEIASHHLTSQTLSLKISLGIENEGALTVEIRNADLGGRFGTAFAEQQGEQKFFLACKVNPLHRERIRAGTSGAHWQITDTKDIGLIFVRDADAPPGWPIREAPSYGYAEHMKHYGKGLGFPRLRVDGRGAVPLTLKPGDVLLTGDHVLSPPRKGLNGNILVHLTNGGKGHWVPMAARLPIALLAKSDDVPPEMWTFR